MKYSKLIIPKFGAPEVFEKVDADDFELKDGQLAVQVSYIGINYADLLARQGWYKWAGSPPICPGFEFSGTVIRSNQNSKVPEKSDVFGICKFGAYSEIIIIEENRVWQIPATMEMPDAAAFPAVYLTAYHSLIEIMRIRKSENILIQAVAGGVGTAALQIAKHLGLTTFGTASSKIKLDFAIENGLDFAINYRENDFEKEIDNLTKGKGVKFVLDSLGGSQLKKGYNCLSASGHIVTIGAAAVVPTENGIFGISGKINSLVELVKGGIFHPFSLIQENKGISGVQVLLLYNDVDYLKNCMKELIKLYEKKAIKPIINRIFDFDDVASAHQYMESRKSMGKILLKTRFAT